MAASTLGGVIGSSVSLAPQASAVSEGGRGDRGRGRGTGAGGLRLR